MPEPLLDADAIWRLLLEVADELQGERVEVVIVGGALLALNGLRETTRDVDDLEALWPRCSFETPDEAAVAYRAAYPHEHPDPHLAEWIASVI